MWVLLKVLLQVLSGVLRQFVGQVLPRILVWVVIPLVFVAVFVSPVLLWLLVALVTGPPEAQQCSTATMAGRAPDHAAAGRLQHTLGGLPGVVTADVEFDDAARVPHAERVRVRVAFAADVGPDQVLAAVAPAVDGLRGPEFAGLDAYVAFAIGIGAPGSEYQVFGLPASEDVVADASVWLGLHSRHPGTRMQRCSTPEAGTGRTVEVPVAWHEDPDVVSAAFAELRSLPSDGVDWSWTTVRAVPGPTGPTGRATFAVYEWIPEDETIREMTSTVRRPPSMSPSDELEATVISYPPMGDAAPRMEVTVEFGLEELRHASASEVLAPASRAQRVAAAFAAQVEATGGFSRLDVSLWDTQILDE